MIALAIDAAEAGEIVGWRRRDGTGNGERVRLAYRDGRFPPPIDPDLPPRLWRWSTRMIEAYVNGEWRPENGDRAS
jgi:hypothetical protein